MASPQDMLLTVWEFFIAVVAVILFFIAYNRYRVKKSDVAKTLAITLLFMAIAMVTQFTGQLMTTVNVPVGDHMWSSGNPLWGLSWFLMLVRAFQIAYFFLVLGLYMLHRFALQLAPDNPKKVIRDRIALVMAIVIITFGIIKVQFPLTSLDELGSTLYQVDIWVIVYGLLMLIPVLSIAWHMYSHIQAGTVEQRRLRSMVLMGWILLAMITLLVLDAVFATAGLPDASFWARFAGFGSAMVGLVFVYLSFYAK
jgi:hypothetical protein